MSVPGTARATKPTTPRLRNAPHQSPGCAIIGSASCCRSETEPVKRSRDQRGEGSGCRPQTVGGAGPSPGCCSSPVVRRRRPRADRRGCGIHAWCVLRWFCELTVDHARAPACSTSPPSRASTIQPVADHGQGHSCGRNPAVQPLFQRFAWPAAVQQVAGRLDVVVAVQASGLLCCASGWRQSRVVNCRVRH